MKIEPLTDIRHESGFAYIALTHHPELSSHQYPSSAIVLENGVPLPGPANALHEDIRRLGGGRYSFWHATVYFSTLDKSDPRNNGRTYAIGYTASVFDQLMRWIPSRWRKPGSRAAGQLVLWARQLHPAHVFWATFYWVCFAYVALRRQRD